MQLLLLCLVGIRLSSASWSSEELSLYDLVEELNTNFYDYFGIKTDASTAEIKKAYRKLSLEFHPDRNRASDAADKFRQIVAVYDVLKSPELRGKYNDVLEFGLPDWRQPIFYYRRMRKFTWYEALVVLLSLSTLCHYLMMWAAYYEKKLVFAQAFKKSKKKKGPDEDDALKMALTEYLPQFNRLLPFLLLNGACSFAHLVCMITKETLQKKKEEPEEAEKEKKIRKPAVPRQEYQYEVATDLKAIGVNNSGLEEKYRKEAQETEEKKSGAQWGFDELSLLIRLSTEKYPPGTPNRWELMARQLNRNPEDVTAMAGKIKSMKQEEYSKLLRGQQSTAVNEPSEQKTTEWQQHEQKLFEAALQRYPKGTEERWERIAESVPGKTKEECIARFKELAELIRRKKAAA